MANFKDVPSYQEWINRKINKGGTAEDAYAYAVKEGRTIGGQPIDDAIAADKAAKEKADEEQQKASEYSPEIAETENMDEDMHVLYNDWNKFKETFGGKSNERAVSDIAGLYKRISQAKSKFVAKNRGGAGLGGEAEGAYRETLRQYNQLLSDMENSQELQSLVKNIAEKGTGKAFNKLAEIFSTKDEWFSDLVQGKQSQAYNFDDNATSLQRQVGTAAQRFADTGFSRFLSGAGNAIANKDYKTVEDISKGANSYYQWLNKNEDTLNEGEGDDYEERDHERPFD